MFLKLFNSTEKGFQRTRSDGTFLRFQCHKSIITVTIKGYLSSATHFTHMEETKVVEFVFLKL